jgi:hypothetical protein
LVIIQVVVPGRTPETELDLVRRKREVILGVFRIEGSNVSC